MTINLNISLSCFPPKGEGILLALSGGLDSMVLWNVLKQMGYNLFYFHLHHGLRKEADEDVSLIREECGGNGEIQFVNIVNIAHTKKVGVEEAGRLERYDRLKKYASSKNIKFIITAHHKNDQAETVLSNIFRGADVAGMCGIHESRNLSKDIKIIRPLLETTKEELYNYAEKEGIKYNEDLTNKDNKYTRNKLRNDIIPSLEKNLPGFIDELCEFSKGKKQEYNDITKKVNAYISMNYKNNKLFLQKKELENQAFRKNLWRFLLQENNSPITKDIIKRLDKLYCGQNNKKIILRESLYIRVKDFIEIQNLTEKVEEQFLPIDLQEGEWEIGENHLTIRVSYELDPCDKDSFFVAIDKDKIIGKLQIRQCKKESWQPFGGVSMNVMKYLKNKKVPAHERTKSLAIYDEEGIVWLLGHTISERVKITQDTNKVLQMVME